MVVFGIWIQMGVVKHKLGKHVMVVNRLGKYDNENDIDKFKNDLLIYILK